MPENPYQLVLNLLSTANQLALKAFNAKNPQNLNFILLNDTLHVLPYDLAILWRITPNHKPEMLGVSGQSTYTTNSETVNRWTVLLSSLHDLKKTKQFTSEDFPTLQQDWELAHKKAEASILWLPFVVHENEIIGFWFEKWNDPTGLNFAPDRLKIVEEYVVPAYAAAWGKFHTHMTWRKLRDFFNAKRLSYLTIGLIALSLLIRIPLRVVAPCEVVAKDPYIITAPLEGIIAHINIKPGQPVKIGDSLYDYDPRIPLQELRIAEKQVEVTQSEINRSVAAGIEEYKPLTELASLNVKLQKARLDLEYAKARAEELAGKSPKEGVALIDNPDEWQGRPVKVGERIMIISDPTQTKVRMWIPEADNIQIDMTKPVRVYLNPSPEKSYYVKLNFIAHEAQLSEKQVASFMAEGDWVTPPTDIRLGVKGSAVLYGERVSFLYYIFRKPLNTVRNFVGV